MRPVLYHLGKAGERFDVGDGPRDLAHVPLPLAIGRRQDAHPDVALFVDDPWTSAFHARLARGHRDSRRLFLEDAGSRNGVLVNGLKVERAALLHGDVIEIGRSFFVYVEELVQEPLLSAPAEFGPIVTWHPRLGAQLLRLFSRVRSSEHVVVQGPSGSGRGFLARTIHQLSGREGRLVAVDCRAGGPRNVAQEIFGVGEGDGRLAMAMHGTLFLEHLEFLPIEVQDCLAGALLRSSVATRVVAAVSGDLDGLVRRDMLAPRLLDVLGRLSVETLALEHRLCDLGLLLDDFMGRARGAVAIDRAACRALFRFRFEQHIRGFGRVVEAASALAAGDHRRRKGGMIELMHLPVCLLGAGNLRELLAPYEGIDGQVGLDRTGEVAAGALLKGERVASRAGDAPTGHRVVAAAMVASPQSPPPSSGPTSQELTPAEPFPLEATQASVRVAPVGSAPVQRWRSATVGIAVEGKAIANDDVDIAMLVSALRTARGNVADAARLLGRPRAVVMRWLRDLNLDPLRYR